MLIHAIERHNILRPFTVHFGTLLEFLARRALCCLQEVPPQPEPTTQPGHTVTPAIIQPGSLPHIPKRTLRRRF